MDDERRCKWCLNPILVIAEQGSNGAYQGHWCTACACRPKAPVTWILEAEWCGNCHAKAARGVIPQTRLTLDSLHQKTKKRRVKRHTPAPSNDPTYRNLPLTRGLDAKVPIEIFDYVDQWNWHASESGWNSYYARRNRQKDDICGPPNIQLHIVIYELLVGPIPDGLTVDFVNQNGLDLRLDNLRVANPCEQQWNVPTKLSNTTGFIGVHWNDHNGKWVAQADNNKIRTYIGGFDDPFSAAWVYNQFVKAIRGEFGVCNNLVDRRVLQRLVPSDRRQNPNRFFAA